jgi:hypothetical protein
MTDTGEVVARRAFAPVFRSPPPRALEGNQTFTMSRPRTTDSATIGWTKEQDEHVDRVADQ